MADADTPTPSPPGGVAAATPPPDKAIATNKDKEDLLELDNEEFSSDVETLNGRIVYNADGSAYLIEGDSDSEGEASSDLSYRQQQQHPQLVNALHIALNRFLLQQRQTTTTQQTTPPDIPVTHSFRVYAAKDGLPPSSRLRGANAPSKPVLMCFVCRLSFGYVRSFVAHATGEHALSLSETERDLLSSRDETVSCVIQGGVNEPLLSFLEPIITPTSTAFNTNTSTSSSCGSPTNLISSDGAHKGAPECTTTTATDLATSCSTTTLDYSTTNTTTTSTTIATSSSSSTVINPTTNSPTTATSSNSSAVPNSSTSTTSNFTSCSTTSNTNFVTTNNQSSSSYHNDNNNSLVPELEDLANIEKMAEMAAMAAEAAAKSSPTTPPTAPPAVTPSNGVYDGIYSNAPRTSIEDITTNQTTINRTVLEESSPRTVANSSSKSPLSPQCAHHPDGKVNGVECPKCDMVLGSSRSLGGHMTMMHSRNSCKTLKCPKCNWHYKYQETLEIHMKEKHPENEMTCLYCVTNQAHPRLARGETYTCGYKPYRCEVCNYSTTTKGNLSIHMQSDKHINNVQELQTNEHLAVAALQQQQQSQVQQSQVQVQQSSQQQAAVEKKQQQQQMGVAPGGTAKPKANWRCDVCNYETNVARNLRIHMTSEKHTHNLMVIQQNMKHMHHLQQAAAHPLDPQGAFPMLHPQLGFVTAPPGEPHLQPEAAIADMAYNHALLMMASQQHQQHQASQVNQVNQQRLLAAAVKSHQLAAMGGHSMGGPVMNGPLNLSIPPQMEVELGDGNGQKPDIPYEDCYKMFQCCVCTTYSSDSLESLSQHVQLDRSRLREDEVLAIVAGTSVCKLCSYKTNLKANFQLHCKTDKHLQRLHHVNHIKEGGARNEWKLKYVNVSNPVQARCNPCEFFTNSLHKLQLHASSPKHELNARLFMFLERAEAGLGAATVKSYHCTACSVSVRTKVNLVQHAGTVLHARTLQALVQGEEPDMRDVFVVKEAKQASPIDDDKDLNNGSDISDHHHLGDDVSASDAKTSANKSPTTQDSSSMLKQALLDRTETTADSHNCPFCPFACSSEVRLQMHVVAQHGGQNRTQAPTLACPLCQDAFKDLTSLENHIMDTHNVNSEGVKRLMALVDKTEWLNSQNTSSSSQNTSSKSQSNSQNTSSNNQNASSNRQEDIKDVKMMDVKPEVSLSSALGHNKPTTNGPAAEESSAAINMVTNDTENAPVDVKQEVMETDIRSGDESDEKEDEDTFTCTPCGRVFNQVEDLFCHQNELGHLEYRNNMNTGGKSGYLCWKKGCGMTFNTITSTQFHFKEVHANRTSNSVSSDRHVYKYRCTQCSLAFKTQEKLKLHAQYHLIRAATKCVLCGKSFRTVIALQKHVETSHASMSKEELQQYRNSLLNNPLLTGNVNAGVIDPNTIELLKKESIKEDICDEEIQDDNCEDMDTLEEGADEVVGPPDGKDQQVLEDYINSQAIAEDSYNDPNRKYKCHRCKVAFTRQSYLTSHNKTLLHRKGEKMNCTMEKYLDPNRPFKCEVCKESFTQKNILLVHYNSVSHLHKLKLSLKENSTPNVISSASPGSPTGGNNATPQSPSNNSETSEKKPYKCNLCKLSYSTSSTLDIHVRSVLHQSKASRIQELVLSGELDLSTPLVERPDSTPSSEASAPRTTNEQSNTPNVDSNNANASTPVSAASKVSEAMTPASVAPPTSVASGMAPMNNPFQFPLHPDHTNIMQQALNFMNQAPMSSPPYQCNKCGSMCSSHDALVQHQNLYCYFAQSPMAGMPNIAQSQKPQEPPIKEEPSNPEKPRVRAEPENTTPSPMPLSHNQSQNMVQRAPTPGQQMFKSRYPFIRPKPLIFRHLLESFGFDVVMQFNESNQRRRKEQKDQKEEKKDENKEKPAEDKNPSNDNKVADDTVINVENKENVKMDLPEINRSVCNKCNKDFSSIWVLKSHQEEAHKDIVTVKSVEKFAEAFKDYYDRRNNTTHAIEDTEAPSPTSSGELTQPSSAPVTPLPTATPPTSSANMSNQQSTQDAVANHMAMTAQLQFNQLLMSMGMGLGLPMGMAHMGVPFGMNMNMHGSTPLIPLMMPPPPLDPLMAAAFGGHPLIAAGAGADPNFFAAQQKLMQQQQINAVNQQKRARTRINDEQLKILRAYFDINNSPTEEQLLEMSERSGLQLKVIKHWFRNTLFKERQRNKDSPYNFNNPPSTFLNLEEYEKTGETKTTPIPNQNGKESNATAPQSKDLSSQNKDSNIGGQTSSSMSQNKDCNIGNNSLASQQNKDSNIATSIVEHSTKREIPDDKLVIDEGNNLNNQSDSSMKLNPNQSNDLTTSKSEHISTSTPKRHPDTNNIYNMSGSADMMADTMGIPTSSSMMLSMDLRTSLDSFNSSYGSTNMFQGGMMSFMAPGSVSPPTSESPHSTGNTPSSTPTPSCSGGGKRANRTRFTDYQIKVLQEFFESNAYPKDDDLEYLSKLLNLSPRVIVVWFQNARQKARKVYENQPPITTTQEDEAAGRFQRTPGLNYQCKKCLQVFQRYYELIKHQKSSCFKDENPLASQLKIMNNSGSEDRMLHMKEQERRMGNEASIMPSQMKSITSATPEERLTPNSLMPKSQMGVTTSTPNSNANNCSTSQNGTYRCDKCALSFSRFELWREHQVVHLFNPTLFPPAGYQGLPQGVLGQYELNMGVAPGGSQKRKMSDDEESAGDHPRDKRLRTTILPEQLDYLYQQYQIESNPSRKMLENIAREVGLKKRVVQVWFQNTRARERKGQFRAHQQVIHKRCPFCRALFKARSALESHLATRHADQYTKGDINIDALPDGEDNSNPEADTMEGDTSGMMSQQGEDLNKMGFSPNIADNASNSNARKLALYYENSLRKLLDDRVGVMNNTTTPASHGERNQNQNQSLLSQSLMDMQSQQQQHNNMLLDFSMDGMGGGPKQKQQQDSNPKDLNTPLDLSKPLQPKLNGSLASFLEDGTSRSYLDDTVSETYSESTDNMDDESNPTSPSGSLRGSGGSKRFRTQMTTLQLKVMKSIFVDYKTPSMSECESLGREIGLPKRVVQVWYQNARAKEKKARLAFLKTFGHDMEPQKNPEECTHCGVKYSSKHHASATTIQEHVFSRQHIENLKKHINSLKRLTENQELDSDGPGFDPPKSPKEKQQQQPPKPPTPPKEPSKDAIIPNGDIQKEEPASAKDDSVMEVDNPFATPPATSANNNNPTDLTSNASTSNAGLFPYMYSPFPGYYGGVPGTFLHHAMYPGATAGYDPTMYTSSPLSLLQLPASALPEVTSRLAQPGHSQARFSADGKSLGDLRALVAPHDFRQAAEAQTDVGFVCKKCHSVFPVEQLCLHHQRAVCFKGTPGNAMLRLVQTHVECRACREKFATILDFKFHCDMDRHVKRVQKIQREMVANSTANSVANSYANTNSVVNSFVNSFDGLNRSGNFNNNFDASNNRMNMNMNMNTPTSNNNPTNNNNFNFDAGRMAAMAAAVANGANSAFGDASGLLSRNGMLPDMAQLFFSNMNMDSIRLGMGLDPDSESAPKGAKQAPTPQAVTCADGLSIS